jgi:hypothetical protein
MERLHEKKQGKMQNKLTVEIIAKHGHGQAGF